MSVQSQAAQPPSVDRRVPSYVYFVAILLIGWSTLALSMLVSEKDFHSTFWRAVVLFAAELAIGCGLLFRQRWAWILGVTTAVVYIVEGLRRLLFVRGDYVVLDTSIAFLVSAIVILAALLPVRARRAFLGE